LHSSTTGLVNIFNAVTQRIEILATSWDEDGDSNLVRNCDVWGRLVDGRLVGRGERWQVTQVISAGLSMDGTAEDIDFKDAADARTE
jgi:hypothetical protein